MSFGVSIYPSKKGHFVSIGVWERRVSPKERERVWDWEGEGLTLRVFLFHFDLSLIPDHPTTSASHQHHVSLFSLSISLFIFLLTFLGFLSHPSLSFRSERVSSHPWLPSASSRSSRTCRKTHQLLAALVSFFFLHFTPHHDIFVSSNCAVKSSFFFSGLCLFRG